MGGRIAVPSHLPLERGELGLLEVRLLTADGNPEGVASSRTSATAARLRAFADM